MKEETKQRIWKFIDRITTKEERELLIERGFSPDECAECHLPGDCPLCGAS